MRDPADVERIAKLEAQNLRLAEMVDALALALGKLAERERKEVTRTEPNLPKVNQKEPPT